MSDFFVRTKRRDYGFGLGMPERQDEIPPAGYVPVVKKVEVPSTGNSISPRTGGVRREREEKETVGRPTKHADIVAYPAELGHAPHKLVDTTDGGVLDNRGGGFWVCRAGEKGKSCGRIFQHHEIYPLPDQNGD